MMKILLSACLLLLCLSGVKAQDQTINGDIYMGAGYHDAAGYGKRINFLGNSDNCFISQFNVAGNITEFRFNIGDDLIDDKFVVGVTPGSDGLWYPKFTVRADGNVGIGVNDPASNLHIWELSGSNPGGVAAATKSILKLSRAGTVNYAFPESAEFRLGHGGSTLWGSQLDLYINGSANQNNIPDQQVMTWLYNGNVGIGILNPQEKLAVNGTIHSKAVTVDLINWPDYVFTKFYKLRPLSELNQYIDQNHHLPEMPSSAEVEKDGLNVGEMNKLLTKKIEELTLYLIEKDNEIQKQNIVINEVKKQVEKLTKAKK